MATQSKISLVILALMLSVCAALLLSGHRAGGAFIVKRSIVYDDVQGFGVEGEYEEEGFEEELTMESVHTFKDLEFDFLNHDLQMMAVDVCDLHMLEVELKDGVE